MNAHELTSIYPLLETQEQKILWILQYSKIHGESATHDKKRGWVQTYQIRKKLEALDDYCERIGARIFDLRDRYNFPIACEMVQISVYNKKKGENELASKYHYRLGCDPTAVDWSSFLREKGKYIWRRRAIEYRIEPCEEQGVDWFVDCLEIDGYSSSIFDKEVLEVIKLSVALTLETMQEKDPDKYAKFIAKFNPSNIREVE